MYLIKQPNKKEHKIYCQTKDSNLGCQTHLINSKSNKIIYMSNKKSIHNITDLVSQICILNGIYKIYL